MKSSFWNISGLWQKEKLHFLQLSRSARLFLLSLTFFELSNPILYSFINAFILRKTANDFTSVGLYNFGWFLVTTLTFVINGWLLRRIPMKYLYGIGLVGQGVVATALFWLPLSGPFSIFLIGLAMGVPIGLFWSNRHFLSIKATTDDNRNYFFGIENIIVTLCGVIVPVVMGRLLVFGEQWSLYTAERAYQWLGVGATGLLMIGAWFFVTTKAGMKVHAKLWLSRPDAAWWSVRGIMGLKGLHNAFEYMLPAMIVFTLLGKEGVLGLIQSTAAIFSTLIVYLFARKASNHHRLTLLQTAVTVLSLNALIFSVFFTQWSAVLYLVMLPMLSSFVWLGINTITGNMIDKSEGGDSTNDYTYIADREMSLNVGRFVGLALFFILIGTVPTLSLLRILVPTIALSQFGVVYFAKRAATTV